MPQCLKGFRAYDWLNGTERFSQRLYLDRLASWAELFKFGHLLQLSVSAPAGTDGAAAIEVGNRKVHLFV
jgi:hypothetical protein